MSQYLNIKLIAFGGESYECDLPDRGLRMYGQSVGLLLGLCPECECWLVTGAGPALLAREAGADWHGWQHC